MDLIYTNPSREDVGVLHNYELDLAFGSGENNFECVVGMNDHRCEFGSYLYIEGTEYGGIIDGIESKNSTTEVVYSGRTWHGILNSKVIQPDDGADHLIVSGEANTVIASLLTRMGLSGLFEASSANSGLTVKSYKMNRYICGYDGILKMLKTVGGKLLFCVQSNGKVMLSVAPVVDYTNEELDSDLIDLDVKRTENTVNHLICLGQGNLSERTVIHLYADESGNISQTQTIFGVDEYVAVFEYPNAESEDDLLKSGMDRLKELMQQDDLSVDVNDVDDPYDVGDLVGASDNITNIKITVPVTKKIVTIKNGVVTIDIQTDTGKISESASGASGGTGGLPGADGKDGKDGADGISCTHEWNGTVLTVTSASGTSSADLKGEKGDNGKPGVDGKDGSPGDTGPQGPQGYSITGVYHVETTTEGSTYFVALNNGGGNEIFVPAGPQGPQGEPGRGVQPDWNQNDSSAEDYVKNRPFYSVPGLADVSVPMESVNTPSGTMYISPYFTEVAQYRGFYLVKDCDYFVTYDDVEYNCKAFEYTTALEEKSVAIGNPELVAMGPSGTIIPSGAGMDAPFAIIGGTEFRSFDGETHYVTIAPGVVKLPNEYLDEEYIKAVAGQGPQGEKGEKGDDGVSVTHSWSGTVLTVTSASGTSSADLKGAKGDQGDTGATGPQGPKGDKGDPGSDATVTVDSALSSTSTNPVQNKVVDTALGNKLDKLSLDYRKAINFGSSGCLYVGKFGVYDTNITVCIDSTTSVTYSGKLVIATQNYVIKQLTVYGDAANTIAPNIFIKPSSTSDRFIEVYFKPASWSKNVVQIYGSAVQSAESVCTSVSSVPDTATQKPTNALTENFSAKSHTHTIANVSGLQSALDGKETSGAAATALAEAKAYTDEVVSGIGDSGGSCSWDDITDKPFITVGSPDTLTWDGSTDGRVSVVRGSNTYYLVSEVVPTMSDFNRNDTYAYYSDGTELVLGCGVTNDVGKLTTDEGTLKALVALVDGAVYSDTVLPKAGIYFPLREGRAYITSMTIPGYTGFDVKEKIDPGCLPDGTPYTETGVEILPETTVEIDPDSGEGYILDEFELVGGNTYTVMWNGTKYSCVAQSLSVDGLDGICFGDIGVLLTGEPVTGEPFVVVAFDREAAAEMGVSAILIALDGSASVTLSITGEVVHKLDEKYLPDTAFLYVNGAENDPYLYRNTGFDNANNRVTNDYLRSLFLGAKKLFVLQTGTYGTSSGDQIPCTVYFAVDAYQDCGTWGIVISSATGRLMQLFTAEYEG